MAFSKAILHTFQINKFITNTSYFFHLYSNLILTCDLTVIELFHFRTSGSPKNSYKHTHTHTHKITLLYSHYTDLQNTSSFEVFSNSSSSTVSFLMFFFYSIAVFHISIIHLNHFLPELLFYSPSHPDSSSFQSTYFSPSPLFTLRYTLFNLPCL